ncbi:MAG TPA: hypothetical protein PKE55_09495 [Kiritimatiellia bacterium]|nr:hypothetical protein [Kiritimatiellia bacterium]
MNSFPPTSSRQGGILLRLSLLIALAAVLILGILSLLNSLSRSAKCAEQLRDIYLALELFELDKGSLPHLAFFPDDPLTDTDSLRVVLEEYGLRASSCVCPAAAPRLRDTGLTYIWNVRLNGANLQIENREREWMLIDAAALSADLPSPHLGGFNVLFTDGTVERIAMPLSLLRGL